MRSLIFSLSFLAAALVLAPSPMNAACRTVSDIRIDSSDDAKKFEHVCEAQNVTIFADNVDRVILPNLERAGLVNIDSRGLRAVALPALKQVRDLYVQGSGIEIAEFPSLQVVQGRFAVLSQPIKFLNLPQLTQVGRLIIQGCSSLEFIFADKLQSIGSVELSANRSLSQNVVSVLEHLSILTPEEYAQRQAEAEKMRIYRQQLILNGSQPAPIRPTGHPTHFRDYMTGYYADYPSQYHDYWYSLSPWGFWLWHTL
jgi:hypothetical protein